MILASPAISLPKSRVKGAHLPKKNGRKAVLYTAV